jgi:hypothetical protein
MRRLLVLALTILAPAMAHAKCMPPSAFVSPPSGATLPPNPVLHVFVPSGSIPDSPDEQAAFPTVDLSADGAAVASQVELVSRAPAFWTYRLTIAQQAPAQLKVIIGLPGGWKSQIEATYLIGPAQPAASVPSRATGRPARETRTWTCSHQLTWNVPLRVDSPAYRVEWAYSLEQYEAGPRASIVFPRRMDSFFNWRGEPEPSPPRVELGHVDCTGTTVSWAGRKRIWAGIWALQPDGTEIALNEEPIVLLKP